MAKTVNVANARSSSYAQVLKRITKDGVCPFCEKHFLTYHTRPIIRKGKFWILTENFHPYEGAKHHLLAVSRKHVEHFEKLPKGALDELFSLFKREARSRGIKGGSVFMRFGDTDYTGSSVKHLHAHLISGAKRSKSTELLLVPLSNKRAR
jgi:diadenosine tetraphosphate (Ap4A) HIT family hydrolase